MFATSCLSADLARISVLILRGGRSIRAPFPDRGWSRVRLPRVVGGSGLRLELHRRLRCDPGGRLLLIAGIGGFRVAGVEVK